jgi:hypothetical protein
MAAKPQSMINTILYILQYIFELPFTAVFLSTHVVIPEFTEYIKMGAGKSFNPEKDIGDLSGKVILVTGGISLS